jgi:Mor family transcriptional regulator
MPCVLNKIKAILTRHGVGDPEAERICAAISEAIGGQRVYVAVRPRSEYAERNAEIAGAFKGNNHAELADAFGLTPRQVRRIVHKRKHDAAVP